jgi:hypothetical protein
MTTTWMKASITNKELLSDEMMVPYLFMYDKLTVISCERNKYEITKKYSYDRG